MNTTNIVTTDFKKSIVYKIAQFFFLMFWLLKPFYIQDSGSLQIGDICMGISFILIILAMALHNGIKYNTKDLWFLAFFFASALINFIYYLTYSDTTFLKPILFFTFSFLTIYSSRVILNDEKFLKIFSIILKLNLWIQVFVYSFGLGEYLSNELRYMGTYNDPNQFAFGILTTYCLLYCVSRKVKVKFRWIYFFISLYLIYESASTAMLLTIGMLFVFEQYFIALTIKYKSKGKRMFYYTYIIAFTLAIILIAGFVLFNLSNLKENSFVFERLLDKFSNANSLINSFINDRQLTPILEHPQYLLFGSGEGYFKRFSTIGLELHSTWLGIWFYYGIIPFSFLLIWIYKNIKKVDKYLIPVYLCIFIEAFTLINHRQPSFWVLIVLGSIITNNIKSNNNINIEEKNE